MCTLARGRDGSWVAYPLLGHAADAPEVANLIDRSVAIAVDGLPDDVEPLVPHLRRAGELHRFRNVVVPYSELVPPPPDPRTRWATRLDVPALEALFDHYEVAFARGRRARRAVLDDAVRRMAVIVIDGPGRLDAAMVSEGFTPRYQVWSHGRVHPDARGQGLSWVLVSRAGSLFAATGLGVTATVADSNPMTLPTDVGRVDRMVALNLSLPDRFPAERQIRRQLWRLGRWLDRTAIT